MKSSLITLALLTLGALNANAVYIPKKPGQITHSQCASRVQAPNVSRVCISTVHEEQGVFVTVTDKNGNGFGYLILEETQAINHFAGTESTSTLTVQLTGSIASGVYKPHVTLAFVMMDLTKTVDTMDRGVIKTLEGKFARIGQVKAVNFHGIAYAL